MNDESEYENPNLLELIDLGVKGQDLLSTEVFPEGTENIERDLESEEVTNLVKNLLDEVPEEQRTAYILCEVDSKNYEEIATITGVPVGTVRSRIFRARQYLMENLEEQL